jgi:hypothetical protein
MARVHGLECNAPGAAVKVGLCDKVSNPLYNFLQEPALRDTRL